MQEKTTLHLLCGKLASGKSILSKKLMKEHNAIIISEDIWLSMLYSEEIYTFQDYLIYSQRLKIVLKEHVKNILESNSSVILDFPANTVEQRNWFKNLIEQTNSEHILHYINATDETCKNQLQRRNKELPRGSRITSEEEFDNITKYFEVPTLEEGLNIRQYDVKCI